MGLALKSPLFLWCQVAWIIRQKQGHGEEDWENVALSAHGRASGCTGWGEANWKDPAKPKEEKVKGMARACGGVSIRATALLLLLCLSSLWKRKLGGRGRGLCRECSFCYSAYLHLLLASWSSSTGIPWESFRWQEYSHGKAITIFYLLPRQRSILGQEREACSRQCFPCFSFCISVST